MTVDDIETFGPKTKISQEIHATKYRGENENFYDAMCRISAALADNEDHRKKFKDLLLHQNFLPGGRIQSSIGSPRKTTANNCFLSGTINDSMLSIMENATKAALTMRMGGGIGYDFSGIRPKGSNIVTLNSPASGPISFMKIYDAVCSTVKSAGSRRGAQMGVLSCKHPDIEEFVRAKQNTDQLTNFNISIGVYDDLLKAVIDEKPYDLIFNDKVYKTVDAKALWEEIMRSTWDWAEPGVLFLDKINDYNNLWWIETIKATNPCLAEGTLVSTPTGYCKIEDLKQGDLIITIAGAKPITSIEIHENANIFKVEFSNGVVLNATEAHIFHSKNNCNKWDQNIKLKDLKIGTRIKTTTHPYYTTLKKITPAGTAKVYDLYEKETDTWITEGIVNRGCGEVPLPPFGTCLLGSINLVKYIHINNKLFDWDRLIEDIPCIVRAMDNVIDRTIYPLKEYEIEQKNKRRMGIGITGLANAGEALGFPYATDKFLDFTKRVMKTLRNECYLASIELAKEKGSFPLFDKEKYLESKFIKRLPKQIQEGIAEHGIRNSHLLSCAPTGTISLSADNVSSGIEPVFAHEYNRTILTENGPVIEPVLDYGVNFLGVMGRTIDNISAIEHLNVLTTVQYYVDQAVSKTVTVGDDVSWEDFKEIYKKAWQNGAKGVTTFRASGKRMGILNKTEKQPVTSCLNGSCEI